jgi:hypothetical protein
MASSVLAKKIQLGPGRKKNAALILDCFRDVTKLKQYWNKWIVADVWIDIINERFKICDSLKFKSKELNAAIGRNGAYRSNQIDATTLPNGMGVYKAWNKSRDENKKLTSTVAYFITTPNVLPTPPGGNSTWYKSIISVAPNERQQQTSSSKRCLPEGGSIPTTTSAPIQKRRRGEAIIRNGSSGQFVVADPVVAMKRARLPNSKGKADGGKEIATPVLENIRESEAIQNQTWWDSPEAGKLFGEMVRQSSEEEEEMVRQFTETELTKLNIREMIEKRIKGLRKGYSTSDGWRNTLDDFDSQNLCSSRDVFNIQMKCRYLVVALQVALDDMPSRTWVECCKEAVKRVNEQEGYEHT